MRTALLDTGVFVALLDRSERNHARCVAFLKTFRGQILTTEPVLAEALQLLAGSSIARRTCLDFVLRGGATLVPQSAESLSRAGALMDKYEDVPMDFADATLVALAEETGCQEVMTLDVRGFGVYRIHGRKPFAILPEQTDA